MKCNVEYSEDCVQETFLVAYQKLKGGEEIKNPRAFLYTTATNFIKKKYNEIQKENDSTVNLDEVEYLLGDDTVNIVIDKLDYKELSNRLKNILSEKEEQLFKYRFVDEMQIKSIAKLLDITPANCSLRITRLRRKIIAGLKEYLQKGDWHVG